jgi:hypothetical protein
MSTVAVRYRATPEQAAENQRCGGGLQRARRKPARRSSACRLPAGRRHVILHIAEVTAAPNPLIGIASFARFQAGLGDRCAPGDGPDPQQASLVGSYRFFAEDPGS